MFPQSSHGAGDVIQMNFELSRETLGADFGELVCQTSLGNSGYYSGGGQTASQASAE